MEILIGSVAVVALLIIIIVIGYVKSPPDTAYLISGFRKPRILIGITWISYNEVIIFNLIRIV